MEEYHESHWHHTGGSDSDVRDLRPDFDPAERAFYYVHVLEIQTPTWLACDNALYGDVVQLMDDALLVHQERVYTSPIWYTPGG